MRAFLYLSTIPLKILHLSLNQIQTHYSPNLALKALNNIQLRYSKRN